MSKDPKWASAYIGKTDRDWYSEWSAYYATEQESSVIKRHMQWGHELDKLFDEFGIEVDGVWDVRMRLRSCLKKLAEESD